MGRDAGVADAHDGVLAAVTEQGAAAAAGLALVAGLIRVVEVRAARSLQEVAGRGRLVAQLAGRTGHQRARQYGVIAAHARICREVGVAHQCTDAQPAVGRGFDAVEIEFVEIDQVRRGLDLQLHQVEQVGAARDEPGSGVFGDGCGRVGRCVGALVGEGFHDFTPATSAIASWIFE
jgi:hypothetical protein